MSDSEHERLVWLDELCDRFESAWGTDRQFSAELVLKNISAEKAPSALRALLELERDFRASTDRPLNHSEMQQRFPEHETVIEAVAQNTGVRDSLQGGDGTQAPQSTDPQIGVRIPREMGRYRIVRKLGQGAMGSVFLASDEQLGRSVALKIPRGDVQRDAELRARFEREAQAVAALDHPNICRIHDIGQHEGIHYICMGYVEGFPLARFAIAESGLSEQRIADIVLKLAKALATAHEAGFIHRDLKPANVMIDHNDEPVILDFGLARRIDFNEDARVTKTGANVGSPAYMSPEQVDGDQENIGLQTDVYSLGVILYELLTGRLPFEGSMASVMGQIMTKEPDRPSEHRRDLSVRLENICLRMMAKDQAKRHPSMHAVVAALQEYLDKFAATPPQPAPEPTKMSEDTGTRRRRQIEGLIRSADYAKAEKLLVALSRETDTSLLEAATWAAGELPQLRKTREEVRAGRQDIYNTASRLMKSYDYEQAKRLLEEYPYDLRTPKMQQLLERAEGMTNEVERLRKRIRDLRNLGDNRTLQKTLDALLEIKPGDRRAKELREQLMRRSDGPITSLLGKRTPGFIERMSSGLQVGALLTLMLLITAYPAYMFSRQFLASEENHVVQTDNLNGDSGDHDEPHDVIPDQDDMNSAENSSEDNSDEPSESENVGWTDLLEGDLSAHWQTYSGGPIHSDWTLQDGVLSLSTSSIRRGAASLATKQMYSEFELEFDWKLEQGGNSGVIYLVELGLPKPHMGGPEYSLLDDDAYNDITSAKTVTGSVYGIAAVSNAQPNPVGQWNTGRIRKSGKTVTHWLNGLQVAEIEIDSGEWQQSLSERKAMRDWPRFAKSDTGHIVLQDMAKEVAFRNIRIQTPDGAAAARPSAVN